MGKKQFPIQEPDDFDIVELIENVLGACQTANVNVRMPLLKQEINSDDKVLHVYIGEDIRIQLPVTVNRAFNLPDGFMFEKNLTVVTISPTFDISKPTKLSIEKTVRKPGRQILVSSNILDPQMFASSHQKVLRRFLKSEVILNEHLVFNPVQYLTLANQELQTIQISITDEYYTLVNSTNYNTTIVLHLRRKQ